MTPATDTAREGADLRERLAIPDSLRATLADDVEALSVSLTEACLADVVLRGFQGPWEEFGRVAEPLLLDALGSARRDGAAVAQAEIDRLTAALDTMREERDGARALVGDYEVALADKRRLAREIDVAMHGEDGAARQASLCDLVGPARDLRAQRDAAHAEAAALREPSSYRGGAEAQSVRLLLPFVERAAGEGLCWSEDAGSPAMDSADLCVAVADALGCELGDDHYSAILREGEELIRSLPTTGPASTEAGDGR